MHVVDTSGWIEYLQDTHRADLFAAAIEERAHLLVPTTALFEVHRVLSRSLPADVVNRCLDVMRLGRVLGLTDARALAASNIAARHKLAMADVAMYSTALEFGATFWTQDVEYQGLPGVRYQAKTAALFGCWAGLQAQAKFFESTSSLANACLAVASRMIASIQNGIRCSWPERSCAS